MLDHSFCVKDAHNLSTCNLSRNQESWALGIGIAKKCYSTLNGNMYTRFIVTDKCLLFWNSCKLS